MGQAAAAHPPASEPRVVQMPPLSLRADIGPRSIDDEERTVELIFTTGAGVRRRDFWTGKEYIEVLSLDQKAVRLDRLNDGAPLLDTHSAWSVADQLGDVDQRQVVLHDQYSRVLRQRRIALLEKTHHRKTSSCISHKPLAWSIL